MSQYCIGLKPVRGTSKFISLEFNNLSNKEFLRCFNCPRFSEDFCVEIPFSTSGMEFEHSSSLEHILFYQESNPALKILNLMSGQVLEKEFKCGVSTVVPSKNCDEFLVLDEDGCINVIDSKTNSISTGVWSGVEVESKYVEFLAHINKKKISIGRVCNEKEENLLELNLTKGAIAVPSVYQYGSKIFFVEVFGRVRVFDIKSGAEVLSVDIEGLPHKISYQPEDETILVASIDEETSEFLSLSTIGLTDNNIHLEMPIYGALTSCDFCEGYMGFLMSKVGGGYSFFDIRKNEKIDL